MRRLVLTLAGMLLVLCTAEQAVAAIFDLKVTYNHPDPQFNANFGYPVTAYGNDVLIGAYHHDDVAGAAYLLDGSTGALLNTFSNPEPNPQDPKGSFGVALAAVGNQILVGAPRNFGDAGAAYLFHSDGSWTRFQGDAAGDFLGRAVAAYDQSRVLISAPGNQTNGVNAGAAYLYTLDGTREKEFLGDPGDYLGYATGLTTLGNKVVIGAPGEPHGYGPITTPGKVHVYTPNGSGWDRSTIEIPTGLIYDQFGFSVAAVGDKILVGAPTAYQPGPEGYQGGAAYLFGFNGTTWEKLLELHDPSNQPGDWFGASVAGVGNNILVGAVYDDTNGTNAGAAYLFDGSTGQLLHGFYENAANDQFGHSVAGLGNDILVGAVQPGTGYGVAYRFEGVPEPSTLIIWSLLGILAISIGWWRRRKAA